MFNRDFKDIQWDGDERGFSDFLKHHFPKTFPRLQNVLDVHFDVDCMHDLVRLSSHQWDLICVLPEGMKLKTLANEYLKEEERKEAIELEYWKKSIENGNYLY